MNYRHGSMLAAALLASSGLPLITGSAPAQPVKPEARTSERLTKAEKKRARKAEQRAKLAARSSPGASA